MGLFSNVLWPLYSHVLLPFSLYLALFLLLTALLGIDTGLHQAYVDLLLKIFKFCQKSVQTLEAKKVAKNQEPDDSDDDCDANHSPSQNLFKRILSRFDKEESGSRRFAFEQIYGFARLGMQAIVDDDVTKLFDNDQLKSWNLLTRTNQKSYQFAHPRLYMYYLIGVFIRFYIFLPLRVSIMLSGLLFLLVSTFLVGLIPEGAIKRWVYFRVSVTAFRIMSRSLSVIATNHNRHNMPQSGGICVANHTSPIDIIMLSCDNAYALVGQLQGGFLGIIERALNRATSHVFFDRFHTADRTNVTRTLREHAADGTKLPILIFPEGTCINNSAVVMFKKGAFEASDVIYPVAIRYDQRFGDPFWNSTRDGFVSYLLKMMTSWAIVAEVWYLNPMTKRPDETPIDFASRVKAEIARQGGLVDLDWDGQLKRFQVSPKLKAVVQKKFAEKMA